MLYYEKKGYISGTKALCIHHYVRYNGWTKNPLLKIKLLYVERYCSMMQDEDMIFSGGLDCCVVERRLETLLYCIMDIFRGIY